MTPTSYTTATRTDQRKGAVPSLPGIVDLFFLHLKDGDDETFFQISDRKYPKKIFPEIFAIFPVFASFFENFRSEIIILLVTTIFMAVHKKALYNDFQSVFKILIFTQKKTS